MARGKILRNRILSMLVSLALSFCLWLALSGQDTSTVDIVVPLELTNLPSDLVIKSEVPNSVTFQVSANTAQIRFLADRKPHLWINVSTAHEGSGNVVSVPLDSLDLPRGVQVRKATPAVIEFETARLSQKTVPVKPSIVGNANPAYRIHSMIISPDEVVVQGPIEQLEPISFISTTPINIEGLSANATIVVFPSPADLDPSLTVSADEITAQFKVEERTIAETFRRIPIEFDLKNDSVARENIDISPAVAGISVSWPASRSLPVNADDIKAIIYIDGDKLKSAGRLEVPVVVAPPAGVTITAINPVNVSLKYVARTPDRTGGFQPKTEAEAAKIRDGSSDRDVK